MNDGFAADQRPDLLLFGHQTAASTSESSASARPLRPDYRQRPDGSAVQAQLLWLNKGTDLYHVAVYAPTLRPEMTELLFSELSLR